MLRFLFVNAAHPEDQHVSALRVASLGRVIARQGHEVYLLTRQSRAGPSVPGVAIGQADAFDKTPPRILEVTSAQGSLLHLIALGKPRDRTAEPVILRRLATAMQWLQGQSSDPTWVRSAEALLERAFNGLSIDLVWATFTPIESWTIAARFARRRGIPFVADIKDDWRHFVPAGLRRIVSGHVASARAFTANSALQWDSFPSDDRPREVIFSGYWRDCMSPHRRRLRHSSALTGVFSGRMDPSGYGPLLQHLKTWADARQQLVQLKYFGSSCDEVRSMVPARPASRLQLDAKAYIPSDQLMVECAQADFNFYVRAPYVAIHHKATELMGAGRPILVWGAETRETQALAKRVGVPMWVCEEPEALHGALDELVVDIERSAATVRGAELDWLTWENQGDRLLEFFRKTILGQTTKPLASKVRSVIMGG